MDLWSYFTCHLSLQSLIIESSFSLTHPTCLEHNGPSHFTFSFIFHFSLFYQGGREGSQGLGVVMHMAEGHSSTKLFECLIFNLRGLISFHY